MRPRAASASQVSGPAYCQRFESSVALPRLIRRQARPVFETDGYFLGSETLASAIVEQMIARQMTARRPDVESFSWLFATQVRAPATLYNRGCESLDAIAGGIAAERDCQHI
jgi:hypothetical protein